MATTQRFIPGFIASDGSDRDDAIRYFAVQENAEAYGTHVAPAMIPVGALIHDVFDSLEDFQAEKPAVAR